VELILPVCWMDAVIHYSSAADLLYALGQKIVKANIFVCKISDFVYRNRLETKTKMVGMISKKRRRFSQGEMAYGR
jgi:hypothetical protein